MSPQTPKNLPVASEEIASLLQFNPTDTEKTTNPVPAEAVLGESKVVPEKEDAALITKPLVTSERLAEDVADIEKNSFNPVMRIAKAVGPYVLVFSLGVFLYYYYLTDFSFSNLFKSSTTTQQVMSDKQKAVLNDLYQKEKVNYDAWIASYFFEVKDKKIIDPETDNSGNGLTNFQKYLLGLNPKAYDSLGIGKSDTQSIKEGINPLTGNPLTGYQREVIKQYLNIEVANEKASSGPTAVALAQTTYQSPQVSYQQTQAISSHYQQQVVAPVAHQPKTNPVVNKTQTKPKATTTKPKTVANPSVKVNQEPVQPLFNQLNIPVGFNVQNIDVAKPGTLEVPDLGLKIPIIWTQDLSTIDADLGMGVVHMPQTPMPGDVGTAYISGHSSGYAWDNSPYKNIFANLGKLGSGSKVYVTFTTTNGKTIKLTYAYDRQGEFKPGDQNQFVNTADPEIALSTCWPLGGTAKRLVVFAKLTKVEKN